MYEELVLAGEFMFPAMSINPSCGHSGLFKAARPHKNEMFGPKRTRDTNTSACSLESAAGQVRVSKEESPCWFLHPDGRRSDDRRSRISNQTHRHIFVPSAHHYSSPRVLSLWQEKEKHAKSWSEVDTVPGVHRGNFKSNPYFQLGCGSSSAQLPEWLSYFLLLLTMFVSLRHSA